MIRRQVIKLAAGVVLLFALMAGVAFGAGTTAAAHAASPQSHPACSLPLPPCW